MRRLLRAAGVLLVVLLAYLALWPVPADPVAWQAPSFMGYAGPHAPNQRLSAAQVVSVAPGIGPSTSMSDPTAGCTPRCCPATCCG
jgi:hypothetical protein